MCFDCWIILDVNAFKFPLYTIVGIDQPEVGPIVAVTLDVTATKNGSN